MSYTKQQRKEIQDKICHLLTTTSLSVNTIAKMDSMPSHSTIREWIAKDKDFSDNYARAKAVQIELMAEEILEIADDGANDLMTITRGDMTYEQENREIVNRSRLRVDARKWLLSKLAPKKYGDKLDVTTDGKQLPTTINIIRDNGNGEH